MQLFLIGVNILLLIMNACLAGSYLAQGKKKLGALNLSAALCWSLVAMLNVIWLKRG